MTPGLSEKASSRQQVPNSGKHVRESETKCQQRIVICSQSRLQYQALFLVLSTLWCENVKNNHGRCRKFPKGKPLHLPSSPSAHCFYTLSVSISPVYVISPHFTSGLTIISDCGVRTQWRELNEQKLFMPFLCFPLTWFLVEGIRACSLRFFGKYPAMDIRPLLPESNPLATQVILRFLTWASR